MSFRLVVCFYLLTVTLTHSRFYKRPRIIGGHDAVPGEVPHQVSLQLGFLPKYPYKHFCGGSILNEYWILTASHCLEDVRDIFKNSTDTLPKVFKIKAGKYNIREVEDTEQIRNVEAYFMHEDFNGTFNGVISYDIALLRLQEPLKLNQNVTAIKLSQSTDEELSGEVKISGWGELGVKDKYPAILQIETVPVWERLKCLTELEKFAEEQQRQKEKEQEENNDVETDDEDKKKEKEKETEDKQKKKGKPVKLIFLAQEDTLCSGPLTTGVSVCSGDSGGPMTMIDKNGEPELVGISAWAISPCGSKGAPAGYTKVSYYLDWIKKTMVDNPKIIVENNWNNSSSLNPNITDINTTTEKNMDADDKTNSSIYLTTENPKIINLENNSINALVYF